MRFVDTITRATAIALAGTGFATAQPVMLKPVEVLGATPVPGSDVSREHIPSNVQTLDGATLRNSNSLSVPDAIMNRLPSVNVNETQGNPLQVEVNYRGFTASPLLGTPQGLSVYQDGVRINEPFGDVVNWDLIPMNAIESIVLMPGSNPLFGLNTLGGALVLQTRRGLSSPGADAAFSAGSFGRRKWELAHGGSVGATHGFVAFSAFDEDGWRDYSPSRARNAFGKIGQRHTALEWDLAVTYARTRLVGNGLLPESMLAARREQIYTRPDTTNNEMSMAVLTAGFELSAQQRISGLLYTRHNRTRTLNGDVNDGFAGAGDPEGVENRTRTRQRGYGAALQWSRSAADYQASAGASYDRSRSAFVQTESEGTLDPTRAVNPTEDAEVNALLRGITRTASVYLTHTHAVLDNVHMTLAARYNVTRVQTIDELNGLSVPNLNGDYTYRKLNPALGATWQLAPALFLYGGFSQGNRTPSPIELGCADPAQPCTLPNALQSDPYLKQVVARTLEIGARGTLAHGMRWNTSLFRTANRDDILFVGTSASASRGFFQNFGRTRRQGAELGLSGRAGFAQWQASYSYVQATFESDACIVAESNSTAGTSPGCAPEQIRIRPGDTFPGVPRHQAKFNVLLRPVEKWSVGSTLTAFSSQYVRGNENNAHQADGAAFNGSGKLAGYGLLDLYTTYDLGGAWQLFARVSNVFDKGYSSAGRLGHNSFDAAGTFEQDRNNWRNEQFVGPGAPRAGWIGLRYTTRAR